MSALRSSTFEKPRAQMQTLIRMDMAVIEDYWDVQMDVMGTLAIMSHHK